MTGTEPRRIVAADIGGTNARFAIASIDGDGRITLDEPVKLSTDGHDSFEHAWREFERRTGAPLPSELSMAVAGPVDVETIELTNSHWAFSRDSVKCGLGLSRLLVINDLGAIAHAVGSVGDGGTTHLCGPDLPLPIDGLITVIGMGTGLGLAQLLLGPGDKRRVIECEGGHMDFAPHDETEDRLLAALRSTFGRASAERIVSGPGLRNIAEYLAGDPTPGQGDADEKLTWTQALAGTDDIAVRALDILLANFGAVAGNFALAQGADAVVLAGGLTRRITHLLPGSRFHEGFTAKGRFAGRMATIPVRIMDVDEPGPLGAAAAMVDELGR